MLSSLHTIARLGILAFAGLSLAALTAAQMQPSAQAPGLAGGGGENPWQSLCMEPGRDGSPVELVHRGEGRRRLLEVPGGDRWEYMTTSPTVAEDGSMEAVGRFASAVGDAGSNPEGLVGLVRVRLPQGEVLERMDLQVMPTGRPAWDPLDAGHVVFPGASGGLYSYRFTPGASADESPASAVEAVEWRCERPGGTKAFIIDPVWPRHRDFRKYLLVSMTPVRRAGDLGPAPPILPWWIELDDAGEAIVAAGPLVAPGDPAASEVTGRLRQPTVIEHDGAVRLYYARRGESLNEIRICAAELELDPATGRPRIRPGTAGPVGDLPIGFGPMVPSLDGRTAFTYSLDGGRPSSLPLRVRPALAESPAIELTVHR